MCHPKTPKIRKIRPVLFPNSFGATAEFKTRQAKSTAWKINVHNLSNYRFLPRDTRPKDPFPSSSAAAAQSQSPEERCLMAGSLQEWPPEVCSPPLQAAQTR